MEAATVFKVNTFCFSFSIKNVTPVEPFLGDNINAARCIGMRAKLTSVWGKLCWKCQLSFCMVMQITLRETTSYYSWYSRKYLTLNLQLAFRVTQNYSYAFTFVLSPDVQCRRLQCLALNYQFVKRRLDQKWLPHICAWLRVYVFIIGALIKFLTCPSICREGKLLFN